jgi:hypothetical protein
VCLNRISPAEPVRCSLMWVGRGIHRCALTDALAETIAQQESSDAPHFRPHLWREGHSAKPTSWLSLQTI